MDRLLTSKDVADLLRVSEGHLRRMRLRGDGPPFIKLGHAVRYEMMRLSQWMEDRVRTNTSTPIGPTATLR
jgi:hypothetical protein